MTQPSNIPADIYEQADILCDQFRSIDDDREFVARILMEVGQGEAPGLTLRQAECLDAIKAYQDAHGVAPTVRGLMAELGIASTSGVMRLLDALEERGCIKRLQGRARAITIINRRAVSTAHNFSGVN